ncbi:hypothetical protein [Pseudarthrobacter sp. SSS035]|uniref:hypothetical protein n=1 Tax=Pseudarthrobacter sp. SSS035 TaxID=2931399 RepID=UPI00201064EB|nr:hypothetical protein [Pseudarthrobacter sp. SSS035]
MLVLAGFMWLGHHGLLDGWGLLAFTALLVIAVPTSRALSWRIVIAGAFFFGAVPLLWWVQRPDALYSWGHVLVGVLLSGLVVRVVSSVNRRAAVMSLVPSASRADYFILIAAIMASAALAPYLFVFTGEQALGVLLTSWDNSSHFDMYYMLRNHGTVIPVASPPAAGHVWSFIEYPEGFHGALSTMAELVVGRDPGTLAQELVAYSRLSSLVAVASAVVVTAGITSLPWIQRRPLVSAPFIVLVITAWSFGTASHATFSAFQNFLLGVALLGCLMFIAAFADSLSKPVVFAAAAAAVVGIANTWSLLLLLALPAVILAIFPFIRSRWQTTRTCWLANLGTTLAALVGLFLVAQQISRIGTGDVVTALGKIQSSTHGVEIATLLVALASSMLLVHGSFQQFVSGRGERHAAARMILVPTLGLVAVIFLGFYQISTTGRVTYYSLKLALAVELLLPIVACITVTALVDRWLTRHKYVHPRGLAVMSVLTALAATQVFGLTVPDTRPLGMDPLAPYQQGMSAIAAQANANGHAAAELLHAAESFRPDQGDTVFITNSDQMDPLLAGTWYLSLTGTHTDNTNRLVGELRPLYNGYTGNLVRTVENILDADSGVSIVLDSNLREFLESNTMPEPLLSRVISHN